MATSNPGSALHPAANRRRGRTPLATWLGLLIGGGLALEFALIVPGGQRSEGYVRLTYQQSPSGKGAGLRFELPAGWCVRYNGHQHWRGGTVLDKAGRPRIEVWLHDCACPWCSVGERC